MRCKGVSGLRGGKEEKECDDCKWWCDGAGAKVPSRLYGVMGGWELRLRVGKVVLAPAEDCDGEDMCMSFRELARSSCWGS